MEQCSEVFVGIDVAKMRNAIAAADGKDVGEVRRLGEIDAAPESTRQLVKRFAADYQRLHFCYQAEPTWTCSIKDTAGELGESVRDGGRFRIIAQSAP